MTCLLFCEHLDTLLAEKRFFLDLCAFVILKNLLIFSSVLVKVVCFLATWFGNTNLNTQMMLFFAIFLMF